MYTAQAHIAEMIALLGPPPQKLIDQEKHWRDVPWERSFPSPGGTWCNTAREYYGGSFFDSKGLSKVKHPPLDHTSNSYNRLLHPSSNYSLKDQAR